MSHRASKTSRSLSSGHLATLHAPESSSARQPSAFALDGEKLDGLSGRWVPLLTRLPPSALVVRDLRGGDLGWRGLRGFVCDRWAWRGSTGLGAMRARL